MPRQIPPELPGDAVNRRGTREETMQVHHLLSSLRRSEAGQGLAEYALILALIAVLAIAAVTFLGSQINNILSNVGNRSDLVRSRRSAATVGLTPSGVESSSLDSLAGRDPSSSIAAGQLFREHLSEPGDADSGERQDQDPHRRRHIEDTTDQVARLLSFEPDCRGRGHGRQFEQAPSSPPASSAPTSS